MPINTIIPGRMDVISMEKLHDAVVTAYRDRGGVGLSFNSCVLRRNDRAVQVLRANVPQHQLLELHNLRELESS